MFFKSKQRKNEKGFMSKGLCLLQSGRSMIEILGVLGIVALLSIGGLVGYRLMVDRNEANLILNDVNQFAFVIMENAENWPLESEIEKKDFVPVSKYDFEGYQDAEPMEFSIKVFDIPKGVCKALLEKAAVEYKVRVNADKRVGDFYDETHQDLCSGNNDIVFYFGKTDDLCNPPDYDNGETDCNGCACHGVCVEDVLLHDDVCCSNPGEIACNGKCMDPTCPETLTFNEGTCQCDCYNSEVKLFNSKTGLCECPADKPNYFDTVYGPICCGLEEAVEDGECVSTCESGKACTAANENADCCADEFCAFEEPSGASDAKRGPGVCRKLKDFPARPTKVATGASGNVSFLRSAARMSWWSAKNWCERHEGYARSTRADLGCAGISGTTKCTSNIVKTLNTKGWGIGDGDKSWLEQDTNASKAFVWFPAEGGSIMNTMPNSDKNANTSGWSRFAICTKAISCQLEPGCDDYDDDCNCIDEDACSAVGLSCENNNDCCKDNSGCCESVFCAFESPTGNTDDKKGPGICRKLGDFPSRGTKIAGANVYLRSSARMSWWSAGNWCERMGYIRATRDVLGCPGTNTGACSSTSLSQLNELGWADEDKSWLDEANGSNAYTWYPNENSILREAKNMSSNNDKPRFAMCVQALNCPKIERCTLYDTNCNCMEYASCSSAEESCNSNEDCCSDKDYCAFENPTSCSDKGQGVCTNIGSKDSFTVHASSSSIKDWRYSGTEMSWWSAKNWCERQEFSMATLSSLDCNLAGDSYCTPHPGSDGRYPRTPLSLGYIQRRLWQRENGGNKRLWIEDDSCSADTFSCSTGAVADYDRKDSKFIPLCYKASSCATKTGCLVYNSNNCNCSSCRDGYYMESGNCLACDRPHCAEFSSNYYAGHGSTCECKTCETGYTLTKGRCWDRTCTSNSNCNSDELCAFENQTGCKNSKDPTDGRGVGLCIKASVLGAAPTPKTVTVNGQTTQWIRNTDYAMTAWTAENWCDHYGYQTATLASLGCSVGTSCVDPDASPKATPGTVLRALQDAGWTTGTCNLERGLIQNGKNNGNQCYTIRLGFDSSTFWGYVVNYNNGHPLCYKVVP